MVVRILGNRRPFHNVQQELSSGSGRDFPCCPLQGRPGARGARGLARPREDAMTRDVLLARWTEVGDKVVALAEAVPEAKYGWRPTPEARTFEGQLRHLAFWNSYAAATLRGEKPDGQANELPAADYPTKVRLLRALKGSFAEVGKQLQGGPASTEASTVDTLTSFLAHGAEHYGALAVYARSTGIVPPASR
jgi:hypothetical protein